MTTIATGIETVTATETGAATETGMTTEIEAAGGIGQGALAALGVLPASDEALQGSLHGQHPQTARGERQGRLVAVTSF